MGWGNVRKDVRYAAENDASSPADAIERNLNRITNACISLDKRVTANRDAIYRKTGSEIDHTEMLALMQVTIFSKAIGIFQAFVTSTCFKYFITSVAFGDQMAADTERALYVNVLWMFAMYTMTPIILAHLKKFKKTVAGYTTRTVCEDFFGLWTISIMVVNMWAYKDVVLEIMNTNLNPSAGLTVKNGDEFLDAMVWTLINIGLAIALTILPAVVNIILHAYLHGPAARKVEQGYKAGGFAKIWISACPMALGSGLAWRKVTSFPLQILPESFVLDPALINIYHFFLYLVRNVLVSSLIVHLMSRYASRVRRLNQPDVMKRTSDEFWREEFARCFIKAMPFVFAWLWSDFVIWCVFNVGLGCKNPFNCKNHSTEFFGQIVFAIGLTAASLVVVPGFKKSSAMLAALDNHYIKCFMINDKNLFKLTLIQDDLIVSYFGISVGWAWTFPAATECKLLNLSPTCPATFDTWTMILYVGQVIVYLVVCCFVYHSMMEDRRLSLRCNLLLNIQDGQANRVFKSLDADGDKTLSYREYKDFFDETGLEVGPFLHTYEDVDHHTHGDDSVSVEQIATHLKRMLHLVQQKEYKTDESILLTAEHHGLSVAGPEIKLSHDPKAPHHIRGIHHEIMEEKHEERRTHTNASWYKGAHSFFAEKSEAQEKEKMKNDKRLKELAWYRTHMEGHEVPDEPEESIDDLAADLDDLDISPTNSPSRRTSPGRRKTSPSKKRPGSPKSDEKQQTGKGAAKDASPESRARAKKEWQRAIQQAKSGTTKGQVTDVEL